MSALRQYRDDDQWDSSHGSVRRFAQSSTATIPVSRPEVSSPALSERPTCLEEIRLKLIALNALREKNWDNRGSAAVRTDVITFAWSILTQVMPVDGLTPAIVPLGHGGIQIEWSVPGADLEMEITKPHAITATFFNTDDDSEREVEVGSDNLDEITKLIWQNFRR
ncbi:hypothetical protein V1281_001766 [Nitrobacteraceae bacterium AZCC 2161]